MSAHYGRIAVGPWTTLLAVCALGLVEPLPAQQTQPQRPPRDLRFHFSGDNETTVAVEARQIGRRRGTLPPAETPATWPLFEDRPGFLSEDDRKDLQTQIDRLATEQELTVRFMVVRPDELVDVADQALAFAKGDGLPTAEAIFIFTPDPGRQAIVFGKLALLRHGPNKLTRATRACFRQTELLGSAGPRQLTAGLKTLADALGASGPPNPARNAITPYVTPPASPAEKPGGLSDSP